LARDEQRTRHRRSQKRLKYFGRHQLISFDAAHAAVHYPPDRRFRIWVRPSFLITAAVLVLLPVLAAWIEFLVAGLPHIPPAPQIGN
jgi:hypothetical protein